MKKLLFNFFLFFGDVFLGDLRAFGVNHICKERGKIEKR